MILCLEPTKEGKGRKEQETIGGGENYFFFRKIILPHASNGAWLRKEFLTELINNDRCD